MYHTRSVLVYFELNFISVKESSLINLLLLLGIVFSEYQYHDFYYFGVANIPLPDTIIINLGNDM